MNIINSDFDKLSDNYEIIIKICKNNSFFLDFNIENNLFLLLFNEFKSLKNKKQDFALYYEKNKILNIFNDGSSFVYNEELLLDYKYLSNLKFKYDLFVKMYNINNLKNDDFPNQKNYDYIVNVNKIIFTTDKNITIHFIKKYDKKNNYETNEIEIHILKSNTEKDIDEIINIFREKIK
jgi:hypothetical protein